MWGIAVMLTLNIFANSDTSSVSPIFTDSILKNKIDTAKWNHLVQTTDIHRPANHQIIIQQQKQPDSSLIFLYITEGILVLIVFFKVIFDDFFIALLNGILSFKKFIIYYKSKKYDSFFALLLIYLLKIVILSIITYIGLEYFKADGFSVFHATNYLKILLTLSLFFMIKNIIEYVFNWVIGTQETYQAYFLQSLFAEFLLSLVLLIIFLIYIYNAQVSYQLMMVLLVISVLTYLLFNIIRSYQLIGSSKIIYKLHFFLYICAFKVLPFLVLVKYMLNNIV